MATTYSFIDDAANKRWSLTQVKSGSFRQSSWYAKGSAVLKAEKNSLLIQADDDEYEVKLPYLALPVFTDLEDAFNKVSAIMNG